MTSINKVNEDKENNRVQLIQLVKIFKQLFNGYNTIDKYFGYKSSDQSIRNELKELTYRLQWLGVLMGTVGMEYREILKDFCLFIQIYDLHIINFEKQFKMTNETGKWFDVKNIRNPKFLFQSKLIKMHVYLNHKALI